MEILSPRKIKRPGMSLILSHTSSFNYSDPVLNVPMTKRITTLTLAQFGDNPPPVQMGSTSGTDERVKIFAGMQSLIKSCVDNAEDIKDRLLEIVLRIEAPKTEEKRIEIMKMDFMALKQWFMDNVRTTKIYKGFKEFTSTKKLKDFSRAFNTFILDRNKYTHGQLCFLSPNYDYVLEYIETPAQQKEYAFVDTEILQSYNSCYKTILGVVSEYNVIQQNRILEEYRKNNSG